MINEFKPGKEKEIQQLIKSVFDEFVGHEYSDEGNKTFNDFIIPEKIVERHKKGNIILTFEENGKSRGIIEIRDNNHICLFFVSKKHHNKGIGKKLFQEVLHKIHGKTDFIEVNSSPYAVTIYTRLGFVKTGELTEINGIKYIPMKMDLP